MDGMSDRGEPLCMMIAPPEFRTAEQAVDIWLRLSLSRNFGDTLHAPLPREFEALLDARREEA